MTTGNCILLHTAEERIALRPCPFRDESTTTGGSLFGTDGASETTVLDTADGAQPMPTRFDR